MFSNLLGHVHGRVYYQLHQWYKMRTFVLSSEASFKAWEVMMGIDNLRRERIHIPWTRKFFSTYNFIKLLISHRQNVKRFFAHFNDELHKLQQFNANIQKVSDEDIYQRYSAISKDLLSNWGITIVNDHFAGEGFAVLNRLIAKYGFEQHENIGNDLLCGIEGMESEEPIMSLLEMKSKILENPDLIALFSKTDAEILNGLKTDEFADLAKLFNTHLERYGDRTLEELKLETPSLKMAPELLVNMIRNQLNTSLTVGLLKAQQENIRVDAEERIAKRQRPGMWVNWVYPWVLRMTKTFIKNRENMRFCRSRAFGQAKLLFREVGLRMRRKGLIEETNDVFYLDLDDLRDFCLGHLNGGDKLKEKVVQIKERYELYKTLELPGRIIYNENLPFFPQLDTKSSSPSKGILQGVGISGGKVKAQARVVHKPNLTQKIDDEILVTAMTDPGWIFLMSQAKGIISEKGSLLSHTAIVGRELGIPTVVGVEDIMNLIRTGDEIEMNGEKGTVRIRPETPSNIE